jgi:hypothetical protein
MWLMLKKIRSLEFHHEVYMAGRGGLGHGWVRMLNFCKAPNCRRESTQSDLAFFRSLRGWPDVRSGWKIVGEQT